MALHAIAQPGQRDRVEQRHCRAREECETGEHQEQAQEARGREHARVNRQRGRECRLQQARAPAVTIGERRPEVRRADSHQLHQREQQPDLECALPDRLQIQREVGRERADVDEVAEVQRGEAQVGKRDGRGHAARVGPARRRNPILSRRLCRNPRAAALRTAAGPVESPRHGTADSNQRSEPPVRHNRVRHHRV
jgi:hypothetical protein